MSFSEEHCDQLISAYLDGELSGPEQARVEQLLASSVEHRQLYEELLSVRGSLQSLAPVKLDASFKQRVLQRAETELVAQRGTPYGQPAKDAASRRRSLIGFSPAWSAIAALAATVVLVATAYWLPQWFRRPTQPPLVRNNGNQDPTYNVKQNGAPDLVQVNPRVKLMLLLDIMLTDRGFENRSFEALLARCNIPLEDTIEVGDKLKTTLLKSRFLNGTVKEEPHAGGRRRETEMYYVVCTHQQYDQLWREMQQHPQDFAGYQFDMAMWQTDPNMIAQLDGASRSQTMRSPSGQVLATMGRAQQLIFTVALRNTQARKYVALAASSNAQPPLLMPRNPAAVQVDNGIELGEVSHVLFVLRRPQAAN
jgi:hypothetical protein